MGIDPSFLFLQGGKYVLALITHIQSKPNFLAQIGQIELEVRVCREGPGNPILHDELELTPAPTKPIQVAFPIM